MRVAMSIAGSDSIGGAGIQADLKTFACFNVYGTTAITAVTAQNTEGVLDVITLPPEFVKKQIEAVASDSGIDAVKTGMLSEAEIVKVVAKEIEGIPLVVDPVITAKSGALLLKEDAFKVLLEDLIPLSKIVTPNAIEAERICGMKIKSVEDAEIAAKKIVRDFGCEAAIVKGGHLKGDLVDVLYFNSRTYRFKSDRVEGCFHGTGCAFSAAITANIAKGIDLVQSVKIAKKFIDQAIKYALNIGKGCSCLDHLSPVMIDAEKWRMVKEFEKTIEDLKMIREIHELIPEVGMNIAYALPKNYARRQEDVLAIEGRIVRGMRRIIISGSPRFGASDHLARAILTFMEFYPEIRCAANIKYDEKIIEKARDLGFVVSYYDRREEPEEIKKKEGGTIPWGIRFALGRIDGKADLIYHRGDVGKEPMIVIFGENPREVFEKILKLLDQS